MYMAILLIDLNLCMVIISNGYLIGVLIAIFVLVYLVYSLVKPEKF
jgi:K+-transporting ATPase KdpF subunit